MGPPGRCSREFGMKWRVMLELVGPDDRTGPLAFMRSAVARPWPNMCRK
jgi:hypothetical protein